MSSFFVVAVAVFFSYARCLVMPEMYSGFYRVEKRLVSKPQNILRRDTISTVVSLPGNTTTILIEVWWNSHICCKGVIIRKKVFRVEIKNSGFLTG